MTNGSSDSGRSISSTTIAVDRALNKHFSDWPKYISIFLTIITLFVGMAIWATNSHAEIKDWTSGQDFVTKEELKEVMKERYVPLHEFTKVKQSLDDTKIQLNKMETKLDKVLNVVGDIRQSSRRRGD